MYQEKLEQPMHNKAYKQEDQALPQVHKPTRSESQDVKLQIHF